MLVLFDYCFVVALRAAKVVIRDPKRLTDAELEALLDVDDVETEEVGGLEDDYEFTEEQITQSDHDSSSEQEASDTESIDENEDDGSKPCFVAKDKTTKWQKMAVRSKYAKTSQANIIKISPGPTPYSSTNADELGALQKILDSDMIDKIVLYTNMYIESNCSGNYSRERDAKLTTKSEILALLGLLFLAGVKKAANYTNCLELWTDDGTGIEAFRTCMSYKRFLFLLSSIRFDNKYTRDHRRETDKLAAIRFILDTFIKNCKKSYSLGEYVTIDEKLEPFRGNCSFIQYIPSKPAKYGIKMFALCDSKPFFTYNLEVYCGKQEEGPFLVSNRPTDIVDRLIEPIKGSNRNLTCDNWYTSYPLAETLLENKITLVGTLKKNKREIPREFLPDKQKEVGSLLFGFQNKATLVSYTPKKNKAVLLLSTMHHDAAVDPKTGKPEIIEFYNTTKGGVDTVDQLCSSYSVSRRTRRWPLALFFSLLNVAGINAYILYNSSHANQKKLPRRIFLKTLALSLLKSHLQERANIKTLPIHTRTLLSKYKTQTEVTEALEEPSRKKRSRCYLCGRSKNINTTISCGSCHQFACKKHVVTMHTCSNCNSAEQNNSDSD